MNFILFYILSFWDYVENLTRKTVTVKSFEIMNVIYNVLQYIIIITNQKTCLDTVWASMPTHRQYPQIC